MNAITRTLRALLPDLRDCLTFGGLACVCYGVAQFSPAAAWIVGGAAIFWLGVRELGVRE